MKTYKANKELEEILLKQGFIETAPQEDKIKGKKRFRLSENARKTIYFDYENIKILQGRHGRDHRHSLSEDELKAVLLYFKLSPNDYKVIDIDGKFEFKYVLDKIKLLKEELVDLERFNLQKTRRAKINRVLNFYETILGN